jgi:hypothetical protein
LSSFQFKHEGGVPKSEALTDEQKKIPELESRDPSA